MNEKKIGEKDYQPHEVGMKLLLCFNSSVKNATRCRTVEEEARFHDFISLILKTVI